MAPRRLFTLLFLLLNLGMSQALAQYFKTLPKGVRVLNYRHVETGTIQSGFGENGQIDPFYLKGNIDAKSLEGLNDASKFIFGTLKEISEEAYQGLTFGEYEMDYSAQSKVDVVGLGWGLTNRATFYAYLPIYSAQVDINVNRTQNNNFETVSSQIQNANSQSEFKQLLVNLTNQLPDADGELLQSVLVNYYGYKPLGTWNGSGMGDLEFGIMQQLHNTGVFGVKVAYGAVAPTGKTEDPDIIQDFGFGDGQWDVFGEIGAGYILNSKVNFNGFIRHTYQHSFEANLRAPESASFPLTARKADFKIKPGNKTKINAFSELKPNRWWTLKPGFEFETIGDWKYSSQYSEADEILSSSTGSEAKRVYIGAKLTSVQAYLDKDFVAPMSLELTAMRELGGRNTPQYDRFDLELRLFF